MPDTIRDGKGRGFLAAVNDGQQLETRSIQIQHIASHSETDETAFCAHMHFTQDVGAADEYVGSILYTGSKRVLIERVVAWTDEGAGNLAYVQFLKNPTGLAGGAALTPANLNFSSNVTIGVTCLHQDDVVAVPITVTAAGEDFMSEAIPSNSTVSAEFNGSVILGIGDAFLIVGNCATAGSLIRASVFFFEADIGG